MFRGMTRLLLVAALCAPAPSAAELSQADEARARRLLNALGCKGCHQVEGDGGSLAPSLDGIGQRMNQEQIITHLKAHRATRQTGFMPSYATTDPAELKNLSAFLLNLK